MPNSRNINKSSRKQFYSRRGEKTSLASPQGGVKKLSDILPSPSMLESYEEIVPGMSAQLLTMVKEEQEQRHKLEVKKIKMAAVSNKIGQLLSFVLAMAIIYFAMFFMKQNHTELAITLIICGFAFLTIINLAAIYESKRPKSNRGGNM
jgi:uncharacterized membrane protein